MKKLLSWCIIGMIVLCGLGATVTATNQNQKNNQQPEPANMLYDDELDQSMTDMDGTLQVGYVILGNYTNLSVAQSFIPQKEVLTRVQFFMAANTSTTQPCVLAIRKNLTEENLAVVSLQPNYFPVVNQSPTEEQLGWIDFNFEDIWVVPGQVYYIVMYSKAIPGNFYWIAGNGTNIYLNGTVFISVDNGNTWGEFPNADGCFKTYGLRETFLEITMNNFSPFGMLSYSVKNIGNYTAWDVVTEETVKGGILGLIDVHGHENISELPLGVSIGFSSGIYFGLGKITISLKISGANVKEMSIERNAKIFLIFIMMQ
jgi:hypothetical protein